jgi:adenylate cyclase
MSINRTRRWRILRTFVLGWVAAFTFLTIVRGSGTIEEGSANFGTLPALIMAVVLGCVFGAAAGLVQIGMEERMYRRLSLRRLLLLRTLFAAVSLVSLVLFSYVLVTSFLGVSVDLVTFLVEPGSFAIYFYILSADLVLVLLRQVNLFLGEGNLWRLLAGRFYTPREEDRIFMFLDLESSTTHAEALGHVQYSSLIQDCFDDLGVVADFEAAVYQYVGDGAVLTWSRDAGLARENCIRAFTGFRHRLEGRAGYYENRYGVRPRFTAGVNMGPVVVTEVGRHKKEIAYHGDTINTAARIQGQCKPCHRDLLISGELRDALGGDEAGYLPLGEIALRGKGEPTPVFAVAGVSEQPSAQTP